METLYYVRDEVWKQFLKQAHAPELKNYTNGFIDSMFHSFNDFFCVVEQNASGLEPRVEGVSKMVLENGHIKVNVYVSYAETAPKEGQTSYYYIIKIPEGMERVDEIGLHPNKYNRGEDEIN